MDFINNEVIAKTIELLNRHLCRNQSAIELAYCKTDEGLDIGLKVTYKPQKNGTQIKTAINFVSDRVKDSNTATVEDNAQLQLFDGQGGENVIPIQRPRSQPNCGYSAGQWRVIHSRRGLK